MDKTEVKELFLRVLKDAAEVRGEGVALRGEGVALCGEGVA